MDLGPSRINESFYSNSDAVRRDGPESSSPAEPWEPQDPAPYKAFDALAGTRQLLLAERDRTLDGLSQVASRMNQTALVINHELQEQHRMLEDLDTELDRETEHMHSVLRSMARILKTSSRRQLCTVLWLTVIAILLTFLLFL